MANPTYDQLTPNQVDSIKKNADLTRKKKVENGQMKLFSTNVTPELINDIDFIANTEGLLSEKTKKPSRPQCLAFLVAFYNETKALNPSLASDISSKISK